MVTGALVLAGCGREATLTRVASPANDVLHVADAEGVTILDTTSSRIRERVPGGVASRDWVFATTPSAGGSTLSAIGSFGRVAWTHDLGDELRARVASVDGSLVALLPASYAAVDPYRPSGRPHTRLTVASTRGARDRVYDLPGNFEPEAFTSRGDALFVIQYLPAMEPDRYRVRKLDLGSGEVGDVFSVDGHLQESMGGTARVSALSGDGTRLYTLYTTEGATGRTAFVHVLDLVEGWAHCVTLPSTFAELDQGEVAVTTSPGGRDALVVDGRNGIVVGIDAARLMVDRRGTFTVAERDGPVSALAGRDGGLYVARGRTVTLLDRDLAPSTSWQTPELIYALHLDPDGSRLWQVGESAIFSLAPASGDVIAELPFPVGAPDPAGDRPDEDSVIKCAC